MRHFNGDFLREMRKKNNYSLRSLAKEITNEHGYRVSFQWLALLEAGESEPNGMLLIILAKIFGIEEKSFYQ